MTKEKIKILNIGDINSSESLLFHICKKLKLIGWQFDKLDIEDKIKKYLERNPEKILIVKINRPKTLERIREIRQRSVLSSKSSYPNGYELGNPLNRWISDSLTRSEVKVEEDNHQIDAETGQEFEKILDILNKISKYCQVEVIE